MARFTRIAGIAGALVLLVALGAGAEGSLDVYIGGAFTEDGSLEFRTGGGNTTFNGVNWDDSFAAGIRGGGWFHGPLPFLHLGLAGDLSYFQADVSSIMGTPASSVAEFHMIPLTPLMMARVPLFTSDRYRGGRVAPYFGIGPGLFLSVLTSDATEGAEVGFDVGLDLRVGVATQIAPHFGLFIEYRRTEVDVKVEDDLNDKVFTDLETDHVNVGVALRF